MSRINGIINNKIRVQKKSRLRGSEPDEDFAFYVVCEKGLVTFISNPSLAKFSIVTSHSASTAQVFETYRM